MTWDELEYILRSDGIDALLGALSDGVDPESIHGARSIVKGLRAAWECRPNTCLFLKYYPIDFSACVPGYFDLRVILEDGTYSYRGGVTRRPPTIPYLAGWIFPSPMWEGNEWHLLAYVSPEAAEEIRVYFLTLPEKRATARLCTRRWDSIFLRRGPSS